MQDSKGAGRHSQGFQTLRFDIQEIVGGFAYGIDNFSVPRKISTTLLPAKGVMPQPGESWLISKTMTGTYMFFAALNATGGVSQTIQFPFTYQTADILAGAPLYVPQVGEILVDAWISILTAFNGTTPKADIGSFSGITTGLFHAASAALSLTTADSASAGAGLLVNAAVSTLAGLSAANGKRIAPSVFSGTDVIKLCVSTTGATSGSATGATHGSGIVYLETIPPA